jgi:hypothetical protein
MILNLENAVQLYRLLKPHLFVPDEGMSAQMYVAILMISMKAKHDGRAMYEALSLGTEFDAEYYTGLSPDEGVRLFTNKLADNNILTLKKVMEDLTDARKR